MTDGPGIATYEDARLAVGSGERPEDAARALVATMTAEERLRCLDGDAPTWAGLGFLAEDGYHKAPFLAAQVERVGFPGVAFVDGPRGCVVGNCTSFPVSMARGATWDPDLEERVGEAIGKELRATGANLTGAVCINVLRHPAWGRAQETYGEDPFHVGEMGAALTRGLQRHVLACVKHFACNSMENARFTVDVEVDDVALHEVYLPHFRRVVDEGVASVMSAYNSVNGDWCSQSRALLTEILREEWGFRGFAISDWIFGLRDAAGSVNAGLDIEMPYRMVRARDLPGALESGEVSWADVDVCVERIVATVLRFDGILSTPPPSRDVIGSTEHRALAREVAARSVVLLRNEPVEGLAVLPLEAPGLRLAVLGGLAASVNLGDAGSSDVWDLDCETLLDGLRAAVGEVRYDPGSDLDTATSVAGWADAAVVVVGYTYLDEGEYIGAVDPALGDLFPEGDEQSEVERFRSSIAHLPVTVKPDRVTSRPRGSEHGGDRVSLRLPEADVELIDAVASANARTVVVVQSGSAVIVSEWLDRVPAVLQGWYAGCRAGAGLADVIFGTANPSGRLPFSVPSKEAHLPAFERDASRFTYDRWHGWRYLERHGHSPTFPFGFGLSYTSFCLADVKVTAHEQAVEVRGRVRNTGDREGADVVQVYADLPDPDRPPRLVGFSRLEVPAAGEREFEMTVPLEHLAIRDPATKRWAPARNRHRFAVARYAGDPEAFFFDVDLR
jgi:beta-glucosidase